MYLLATIGCKKHGVICFQQVAHHLKGFTSYDKFKPARVKTRNVP
jgi:hypothetical protein